MPFPKKRCWKRTKRTLRMCLLKGRCSHHLIGSFNDFVDSIDSSVNLSLEFSVARFMSSGLWLTTVTQSLYHFPPLQPRWQHASCHSNWLTKPLGLKYGFFFEVPKRWLGRWGASMITWVERAQMLLKSNGIQVGCTDIKPHMFHTGESRIGWRYWVHTWSDGQYKGYQDQVRKRNLVEWKSNRNFGSRGEWTTRRFISR